MTKGNGGEFSHLRTGTESRLASDGALIVFERPFYPAALTSEQSMIGLADWPIDDAAETEVTQYKSQKATRFFYMLRERWQNIRTIFSQILLYEYERGTVFLLSVIAAGAGAVNYFTLMKEPYWLEIAVIAFLFACLLVALRDTLVRRIVLTITLAFIAGMTAAKWETQRHATPMVGSSVSTMLTARIVSMEQAVDNNGKAGNWRIVADVLATEKPKLRYAPQRLRLSSRDLPALAETGAILKGAVRLRPHGGPLRSGQYDFGFHGFFRDIGGNGFYLGVPKIAVNYPAYALTPLSWNAVFENMISQLRATIGGRIIQALPGENGAIATALISGQRAGISEKTNEALRMAGLAHILSISGLHLALAAGIVMVSARGFTSVFPSLSLYYPVKKIAALISLFTSGFYLAVSGADVAALRSFIMLAVMLCAILFDRQALTLRNLAIAAMFSILLTPHEILGPSFQMSYSATGALIAGFAWWKLRKRHSEERTRKKKGLLFFIRQSLLGTAATSLLAGTASGLYAAFHFNNMAPFGMLGNALALPVISVMVMPFAVMALLLMPLGLEWLPLQIMGKGIELVKLIADFVAGFSPDFIPGLLPAPVLLFWTSAMLVMMIFTSHLRLISLILFIAGGVALFASPLPDIIISEDARLVAVRQDNVLYANRSRPAAFTIDNWRKAYSVVDVKMPAAYNRGDYNGEDSQGFSCEDGLCSFEFEDGRILAYAENVPAARAACLIADIVILNYAGDLSCEQAKRTIGVSNDSQVVINRQQLALRGVAEIYLEPQAHPQKSADIIFALNAPERPWHLYRLYSRAARNLAERE